MYKLKLSDWLSAFNKARSKGVSLLEGFTNRLTNEFEVAGLITNTPDDKDYDISNASNQSIATGNALKKSATISKWVLIKLLVQQKRKLNIIKKSVEGNEVNCIALSTKRVKISCSKAAPRSQLKRIFRTLPGANSEELNSCLLDEKKTLLLFIPYRSELWDDIALYWKDNCIIVDYYYLGFLLFTSPAILFKGIWVNKNLFKRKEMLTKGFTLKEALAAILINTAYEELFLKICCSNAVFLTSNSFATEVLRIFLMRQKPQVKLYEILHGVPSLEFEEYFDSIIGKNQKFKQHYFIPQIKGLPNTWIQSNSIDIDSELAINTAMNNYFMSRYNDENSIEEKMKAELSKLIPNYKSSNLLIIVIMGATAHESRFFKSKTFRIEQIIIEHIQNYLKLNELNFKIIYSPHPANNINECLEMNFFKENEIIICGDTNYMWLTADAAIALYSSALFDAIYSDVKVFTPLRVDDQFYEPAVLNLISHPKTGENCLSALTNFLAGVITQPFGNHKSNINMRLPKWIRVDKYHALK